MWQTSPIHSVTQGFRGNQPRVVLHLDDRRISLTEAATRKLADDLLKQANTIWPVETVNKQRNNKPTTN